MTKGLETAMSSIDICSARQATIKDKMEMVLDIGQLLMESGGDSKSIVRDMLRAAAYLGLHWKHLNFHMTYTTIMANYDGEKKSYTVFRKCRIHGINMTTIADVSQLSWRALEQKYETGTFKADLEAMKEKGMRRHYPQWATSLAAGIACGGFCKLFGCGSLYRILGAPRLQPLRRQSLHQHRCVGVYRDGGGLLDAGPAGIGYAVVSHDRLHAVSRAGRTPHQFL